MNKAKMISYILLNICFVITSLLVSCINKEDERIHLSLSRDELNIINQIIKSINHENKIIVIDENFDITYPPSNDRKKDIENIIKYLKKNKTIDTDLIKSFEKNNNKEMVFEKNINFDFNFIWNKQYEPNNELNYYGKITLSRIGFNKEQTKAIIYIGIMLKGEGRGDYYIIEMENNEWKIINIIGAWIT
jgi:hypothetical protein